LGHIGLLWETFTSLYKAEEVQEQGTEENEVEVTGYMRKVRDEKLHNF